MARVAAHTTNGNPTPFMDRLSHEVIKETSKNLKHYLDVKRRENAFVLNANSSALESAPTRARFIHGTAKQYPPLYSSSYSDNDIKVYTRSFQHQQRHTNPTFHSPEKRMCREELQFHMRTNNSPTKESQKFAELRLRPQVRSSSSCSFTSGRDYRREPPKPAFKLSRHDRNQLIDDTANILASMIHTRRSIYESNLSSQQIPHTYVSRNTNPSPRPIKDPSNGQATLPALPRPSISSEVSFGNEQEKKQKRTTKKNTVEQALCIMRKAKPITRGLLCEYKVLVTTGNCNGASTDAPIRIKFYGTNGYTSFLPLVNSETHRVQFRKDQTDVFSVQTDHVGQLAGITIGHDQKDIRSGWFLSKVSITDPIREITYDIPCNAWLSSKSDDQKTMRDFPIASMISHKKHDDLKGFRDSDSDHSTTIASDTTNETANDQFTDYKRKKKHHKQLHVSIDPRTDAEKRTLPETNTNHRSKPRTGVRADSPSVLVDRARSPIINLTSSSDTEIEDTIHQRFGKRDFPDHERFGKRDSPDHERFSKRDSPDHERFGKRDSPDHERFGKRDSPVHERQQRYETAKPLAESDFRDHERLQSRKDTYSSAMQTSSDRFQKRNSSDREFPLLGFGKRDSPDDERFDQRFPAPGQAIDYKVEPAPLSPRIEQRYSPDLTRPSARLEKRQSPISRPPERPIKSKEETDEDDGSSFFD